jgi:hypothetical protein
VNQVEGRISLESSLLTFSNKFKKNKKSMPRIPQPPSLESKSPKFGDKDPKVVAYSAKNTHTANYQDDDTNDGS